MRHFTRTRAPMEHHDTLLGANCLFLLVSWGAFCGTTHHLHVDAVSYVSHRFYGVPFNPRSANKVALLPTQKIQRVLQADDSISTFTGAQDWLSKPRLAYSFLQILDGFGTHSKFSDTESHEALPNNKTQSTPGRSGPFSSDLEEEAGGQSHSWVQAKAGFKKLLLRRATGERPSSARRPERRRARGTSPKSGKGRRRRMSMTPSSTQHPPRTSPATSGPEPLSREHPEPPPEGSGGGFGEEAQLGPAPPTAPSSAYLTGGNTTGLPSHGPEPLAVPHKRKSSAVPGGNKEPPLKKPKGPLETTSPEEERPSTSAGVAGPVPGPLPGEPKPEPLWEERPSTSAGGAGQVPGPLSGDLKPEPLWGEQPSTSATEGPVPAPPPGAARLPGCIPIISPLPPLLSPLPATPPPRSRRPSVIFRPFTPSPAPPAAETPQSLPFYPPPPQAPPSGPTGAHPLLFRPFTPSPARPQAAEAPLFLPSPPPEAPPTGPTGAPPVHFRPITPSPGPPPAAGPALPHPPHPPHPQTAPTASPHLAPPLPPQAVSRAQHPFPTVFPSFGRSPVPVPPPPLYHYAERRLPIRPIPIRLVPLRGPHPHALVRRFQPLPPTPVPPIRRPSLPPPLPLRRERGTRPVVRPRRARSYPGPQVVPPVSVTGPAVQHQAGPPVTESQPFPAPSSPQPSTAHGPMLRILRIKIIPPRPPHTQSVIPSPPSSEPALPPGPSTSQEAGVPLPTPRRTEFPPGPAEQPTPAPRSYLRTAAPPSPPSRFIVQAFPSQPQRRILPHPEPTPESTAAIRSVLLRGGPPHLSQPQTRILPHGEPSPAIRSALLRSGPPRRSLFPGLSQPGTGPGATESTQAAGFQGATLPSPLNLYGSVQELPQPTDSPAQPRPVVGERRRAPRRRPPIEQPTSTRGTVFERGDSEEGNSTQLRRLYHTRTTTRPPEQG